MIRTLQVLIIATVIFLNTANADSQLNQWKGRSIEFVVAVCYDITKNNSDLYNPPRVQNPIYSFKVLKESRGQLLYNLLKDDDLIKNMSKRTQESMKQLVKLEYTNTPEYKQLNKCTQYFMKRYTPGELWTKASDMKQIEAEIKNNL